ncbi:MAG: hypothetical protein ABI920_15540 [Casimicrobiaceae bacterium]
MRVAGLFMLALLATAVAVAGEAGEPLAPELAGRWTVLAPNGTTYIDVFALRFEGPLAPGTVRGRLTHRGITCGAKDEPFEGAWDGRVLRFEVDLKANANTRTTSPCAAPHTIYVLERKSPELYEGTITNTAGTHGTLRAAP